VVLASLAAKGRDNARTPMHWDASEHAGFTTGEPWLPVQPSKETVNAEAAVADPDSVFHHYRRLIELRHRLAVVVEGRFDLLLPDHDQIWAFTRTLDDTVLLVLANCSSTPATVPLEGVPAVDEAEVLLATHPVVPGTVLRAWESRILRLVRPVSRTSPLA
jgi:oligo-1,6-glucosidase